MLRNVYVPVPFCLVRSIRTWYVSTAKNISINVDINEKIRKICSVIMYNIVSSR